MNLMDVQKNSTDIQVLKLKLPESSTTFLFLLVALAEWIEISGSHGWFPFFVQYCDSHMLWSTKEDGL